MLSKEQERDEGLPYTLSSMKYSEAELKQYKMLNKGMFRLDETEKETFELLKKLESYDDEIMDEEGLPYSYLINFLINIREIMTLNERNFVHHVEKLLNQHFKSENEAPRREPKKDVVP